METIEIEREVFVAADVILLIIRNDGELIDDIEYPQEFNNAYALLQTFEIIKSENGRFVSAANFDAAAKLGVKKFVEKERARTDALKARNKQIRNIGMAALTTAAVAAAGYFYRREKKGSS